MRLHQCLPGRGLPGCLLALLIAGSFRISAIHAENAPVELRMDATADAGTTVDIVNALKKNAGNPQGARASFAKGQCVSGTYTPSPQAARITRSLSFTQPSEVLGRFSVGGGNPTVPDTTKTVLRGFSFHLGPPGHTSDVLVQNAPVHFAESVDQMLGFLQARTPGPDGKPDADRVKAFSAANPKTLNQGSFIAANLLPGSFAGSIYWGVHAFPATNARGATQFIKFKVVPVGGEIVLTDEEARTKDANFLIADLTRRVAKHSVRFDVLAVLGKPGDPTMDVTTRWPNEAARETLKLGTLDITDVEDNARCDDSIFHPANLADGIGRPLDEMFAARAFAYAVSLSKRRNVARE